METHWEYSGSYMLLPSPRYAPSCNFNLEDEAKLKGTSHGYKPHAIFQASLMEELNLEKCFLCQNSITAMLWNSSHSPPRKINNVAFLWASSWWFFLFKYATAFLQSCCLSVLLLPVPVNWFLTGDLPAMKGESSRHITELQTLQEEYCVCYYTAVSASVTLWAGWWEPLKTAALSFKGCAARTYQITAK